MSSQEYTARMAAVNLRRVEDGSIPSSPHETDPLDDLTKTSKKVIAQRGFERLANEMDADNLEVENRRLEAQIRRRQLESEVRRSGADGVESDQRWLEMIQGMLSESRSMEQRLQEQLSDAQRAFLEQRMEMLQEELERLRQPAVPPPAPVDPLEVLDRQLELHERLMERLNGRGGMVRQPQGPPPLDETTIKVYELQQEMSWRKYNAEREDRHRERMAEIEMQREMKERELAVLESAAERNARFIDQTLPKVLELGNKALDAWTTTRGGGGGGGAAAGPEIRAQAVKVPTGAQSLACECGTTLYYDPGWPGVICPVCGAKYLYGPDEGQGAGVQASAPPPPQPSSQAEQRESVPRSRSSSAM